MTGPTPPSTQFTSGFIFTNHPGRATPAPVPPLRDKSQVHQLLIRHLGPKRLIQPLKEAAFVAVTIERKYSTIIHPLHAVLVAGTIPLFLGAALSDGAYAATFEIQWSSFASWFIAGGLVFAGVALLFTIVDLVQASRRAEGIALYVAALIATCVVGFFNALMHARDAWASMPAGLVLSVIVLVLACVATWFGFHTPRMGERS